MIGLPFNDHQCLGAISQILATMVEQRDPVLMELAAQYPTTQAIIDYIRSLPQRDDFGDPDDGPRVRACVPTQRVRIPADDPNCVERAALFVAVDELNDHAHARQLATINTKIGMHTFPVVDGKPVVLDPRVTYECLECGLAMSEPGPVAVSPRNALLWTMDLAGEDVGVLRNGPSALHRGRMALRRMLDEDEIPHPSEFDAIGLVFALAERAARRYGIRWLHMVRTAARAIAQICDAVLSRRNWHFDLGPLSFDTPKFLDDAATTVGKVGLDVGSAALSSYLGGLDLPGLIGLPRGTASLIGLIGSPYGAPGPLSGATPRTQQQQLLSFADFANRSHPTVA